MRARTLGILLFFAVASCCTIPDRNTPIDRLASTVEEYGFSTISAPILSHPDDRFEFDLNRTALQYFNDAKTEVQGGAAFFEQRVQSLQAGLSVQVDPTQTAAYTEALSRYFRDRQRIEQRQRLRERVGDNKVRLAEERVRRARADYEAAKVAFDEEEDETRKSERRIELEAAETKLRDAEDALITAEQESAESRAPENETSSFPTASSPGNTPSPAQGVAKAPTDARSVLAQQQFKDYGGLLGNLSPTVNDRTAIVTAAGDKAVEAIFRVLGKPEKAQEFEGKTTLFGISTVSVNPGWRTRNGFAADVNVQVRMGLQRASRNTIRAYVRDSTIPAPLRRVVADTYDLSPEDMPSSVEAATPAKATEVTGIYGGTDRMAYLRPKGGEYFESVRVVAVSPMTETQTLDLGASFRQRDELALSLALALRSAGLAGQAEAFEQYVLDRQRDVRTRNAEAAVSSYSTGHVFGYQIGPRLKALDDPTKRDPDPDYELTRQTFPVLLIILLDKQSVFPQIIPKHECSPWTLAEPFIEFTQTHNWVPLTKKAACHRLSELDLLTLSTELEAPLDGSTLALRLADDGTPNSQKTQLSVGAQKLLEIRISGLKNKLFGHYSFQPVPTEAMFPEKPVSVDGIVPDSIKLDLDTNGPKPKDVILTIMGRHLRQIRLSEIELVTGDAIPAAGKSPEFVGDSIQMGFTVKSDKEPLLLKLPREDGTAVIFAPPVSVSQASPPASIRNVVPSKLEWTLENGKPDKKDFEILLLGEHLERADLSTLEIFQGKSLAEIKEPPKYDSGAILVKLTAKSNGSVALRVSLRNNGNLQSIRSPEIVISKKPKSKPKPPGETKVTLEVKEGQISQTHSVTIPGGGDPAAVEAAREILRADLEKNKPAAPPDNGDKKGNNNKNDE